MDGRENVKVWGSGRPRREFLHVDDLAAASVHLMNLSEDEYWSVAGPHCSHVNVGSGEDISIARLAEVIAEVAGYQGTIEFDPSMPDGTPRKLLDVSRLQSLGWTSRIPLEEGIRSTFNWMTANWDQLPQR